VKKNKEEELLILVSKFSQTSAIKQRKTVNSHLQELKRRKRIKKAKIHYPNPLFLNLKWLNRAHQKLSKLIMG